MYIGHNYWRFVYVVVGGRRGYSPVVSVVSEIQVPPFHRVASAIALNTLQTD